MISILAGIGRIVDFAVRVLGSTPRALFGRPGSVIRQFERVAWGSLPLVASAGASVGLVVWLQTRRMLTPYSLEARLPSILMVSVAVETGPILASLLVAGRMGAGLAAELGSMSLTEELDAREVLGADTVMTLVAPRALACALALPLLTVLIDLSAFLGGLAAELQGGTLSADVFGRRSLDFLKLSDVIPATLKTAIFGWLIGVVGCRAGLGADRSTESVGRAATGGVVGSMLAIFLANAAMVPLIQAAVAASGWNS